MPIKSSGSLSFQNDIQAEFGEAAPDLGLAEYYGASTALPVAGTLAFSDFYGAVDLKLQVEFEQSSNVEIVPAYEGEPPVIYNPENVTVGTASLFGYTIGSVSQVDNADQGYRKAFKNGNTFYIVSSNISNPPSNAEIAQQSISYSTVSVAMRSSNAESFGWTYTNELIQFNDGTFPTTNLGNYYVRWSKGGVNLAKIVGSGSSDLLYQYTLVQPNQITDTITPSNESDFGYNIDYNTTFTLPDIENINGSPNGDYFNTYKSSGRETLYGIVEYNSQGNSVYPGSSNSYVYKRWKYFKTSTSNTGARVNPVVPFFEFNYQSQKNLKINSTSTTSVEVYKETGSNTEYYLFPFDQSNQYGSGLGHWPYLSRSVTPETATQVKTSLYSNTVFYPERMMEGPITHYKGFSNEYNKYYQTPSVYGDLLNLSLSDLYIWLDAGYTSKLLKALNRLYGYRRNGWLYMCHAGDTEFINEVYAADVAGSTAAIGFLLLQSNYRTFINNPEYYFVGQNTNKCRVRFQYATNYFYHSSYGANKNRFNFTVMQHWQNNTWYNAQVQVSISGLASNSNYVNIAGYPLEDGKPRIDVQDSSDSSGGAISVQVQTNPGTYEVIRRPISRSSHSETRSIPGSFSLGSPYYESYIQTNYNYTPAQETRTPEPAIPGTPAFNYDDARKHKYRQSDASAAYDEKADWPRDDAFAVGWRPQTIANQIVQYYVENLRIDNQKIVSKNLEFFPGPQVVSAINVSDFHSNNIPVHLTIDIFTDNGVLIGDSSELGYDKFFRLYRSQANGSLNLGYISPQRLASKPTITASISGDNSTFSFGSSLDASVQYRLLWYCYQGSKFSIAGGTPEESGTYGFAGSIGSPAMALSEGDVYDGTRRQAVDLFLQARISVTPEVWATVRCLEYFRDGSTKLVETVSDYLDGIPGNT